MLQPTDLDAPSRARRMALAALVTWACASCVLTKPTRPSGHRGCRRPPTRLLISDPLQSAEAGYPGRAVGLDAIPDRSPTRLRSIALTATSRGTRLASWPAEVTA